MRQPRAFLLILLGTTALLYLAPEKSFASGYSRQYLANAWIIPASETAMQWQADDLAWPYRLPFAFPFFGATNTSISVSSNGLISLARPDASFENGIAGLATTRAIAVLWDDLQTDRCSTCDIFISQPDADHVMIRWKAVVYNSVTEVNFEAILGSDGNIQFNYGPNNGLISATVGISDGRGSVIASDITSSDFISSVLFTAAPGKPTASFTFSPASPRVGDLVTFDASASSDDGVIVSYNWTFADGSPSVLEQDPITTHTYTSVGAFSVVLTVTDNDRITSSTVHRVTISPLGFSPVASFTTTPTRSVLGQPFVFNASSSYDPDGGPIVSYRWIFGDGTNSTGPIVTHLYANAGTYNVGLTVTDDEGAPSSINRPVSVVVADVRLLDTYPQFRVLKLRQEAQVSLYAEAINIGLTSIQVMVRFRLVDLKTGTSSVLSSAATGLDVRDRYVFEVSYVPPALTARYFVVAEIYVSGGTLPPESAFWVSSSRADVVIRVIQ